MAHVRAYVDEDDLDIEAYNVDALSIDMPPGECMINPTSPSSCLSINSQVFEVLPVKSDRSLSVQLVRDRETNKWTHPRRCGRQNRFHAPQAAQPARPDRRCVHGFVRLRAADGQVFQRRRRHVGEERTRAGDRAMAAGISRRSASERRHGDHRRRHRQSQSGALRRSQFSNAVLAKIADKLPIAWTAEAIAAGERKFDAKHHALIAIYPNPLNPRALRGAQQRLDVSRVRAAQQRPPGADAARLGRRRLPHAARIRNGPARLPTPISLARNGSCSHRRKSDWPAKMLPNPWT